MITQNTARELLAACITATKLFNNSVHANETTIYKTLNDVIIKAQTESKVKYDAEV